MTEVAQVAAGRAASARQRVLACLAIGCAVLLAIASVLLVIANLVALLGALVGFAVSVAGAWWLITEHPPRRWVGLAGVVVGLIVLVAAVIGAADADRPLLRAALLLALFALMSGSARAAVVGDLRALELSRAGAVRAAAPPGPHLQPLVRRGKVDRFGLVGLAEELGVETVVLDHGLDLEQLARDAIARGADCLGMAGGDGSQALVASIAIEHDVPFVCISAGTRNHFAADLGIDREDPRGSVDAFRDAIERRVDFATVNGRLFVNNVSLGVYATIVQQEGYRDAKTETTKALLPEMLGKATEPFDLQFTATDGTEVDDTFLIQVSNNPYELSSALDLTQRRRLDTGRLGVVALAAATGRDAAAIMTRAALGRGRRSRGWTEFTADRFEVRSRSGTAFAGVDGEALEMPTPLVFEIHPMGLRMLVPRGNLETAERRRARGVSLRQLLQIATRRG